MKAETLKKSILQYAMQGKLVAQDPNDEPASELLKRIKAEKEQLIKDGKIKKEKPLPPITADEIPYELPQGWEWCRLGSILTKLTDGAHKTPTYTNSGIPFLSVKDMSTGKLNFSNTKFVSKEEHEILYKRCNPQKGDLLVTKVGTTGVPVIVDTDREFSLFVSVALLKFNNELINIKYLYYMVLSPLVAEQVRVNTKGVGNQNWVIDKIAQTIITIPPLAEQQRIVEKLEEILPLVEEYGKNEEILSEMNKKLPKQIRQSILQYAVQGKLVPQNPNDEPASELLKRIKAEKEQLIKDGKIKKEKPLPPITEDGIPYKLPQGWEWIRFSECIDVRDGTHDSPKYQLNGYPFVTSKNLNNGKLDFSNIQYISEEDFKKFSERSYVDNEDILFAMIGSIGNPVIVKKDREFSIKNVALFKKSKFISVKYLYYYLLHIQEILKSNASGAVQSFVSLSTLRTYLFALPPLAEQQRIVNKVDRLMMFIETLEKKTCLCKEKGSNLLQAIKKKNLTEYSDKNNNIIDIKEKRAIISAEIISRLYNEQYFGAIKLEKILYLCETHLKINLGGDYKQEAAGPHDAQSRYKVEDILKNKNWFNVRKEQKNNIEVTKYIPLEKSGEISKIFNNVFNAEATEINNLLELFRGKNSDFCESIATLYAVWINRLRKNLSCSDNDLISDFKAWSKQKAKFYDSDLQDRILFMRRKNLIPVSNIK